MSRLSTRLLRNRSSHALIFSALACMLYVSTSIAQTSFEFEQIVYHTCYDGDTCMVSLPGVHPFFGDHILIIGLAGGPALIRKAEVTVFVKDDVI